MIAAYFSTTKREDKQKVTVIDPCAICAGAGARFNIEDNVVFVSDLRKIADYVGFNLLPSVKGFFFGGWWWTTPQDAWLTGRR